MTNTTVGILEQYKKLILKTKPLDHKLLQGIYEAIDREFTDNEKDNLIEILKYNIKEKDQIIEKMINGLIGQESREDK